MADHRVVDRVGAAEYPVRVVLCVLCLTLACVAVAGPSAATPQNPKLLPGDEASKDSSFRVFRDRLRDAVRRRDHRFLLSAVHPDHKVGYSGDTGVAGFKRQWNPENPRSEIWGILGRILGLGAALQSPGRFVVPYQFWKWPENVDGWYHVAVVVKDAKIRAAPNVNAAVIAVVSYDFLARTASNEPKNYAGAGRHTDDPPGWFRVLAPPGRIGYIDDRSAYNVFGYRATFTNETDRWLMDFLGSGD